MLVAHSRALSPAKAKEVLPLSNGKALLCKLDQQRGIG